MCRCMNLGPMTTYQLQKWSHYHLYLQCWPPIIPRIDQLSTKWPLICSKNDQSSAPPKFDCLLASPKMELFAYSSSPKKSQRNLHVHTAINNYVHNRSSMTSDHQYTHRILSLFSAHQRKGSAYQPKERPITAKGTIYRPNINLWITINRHKMINYRSHTHTRWPVIIIHTRTQKDDPMTRCSRTQQTKWANVRWIWCMYAGMDRLWDGRMNVRRILKPKPPKYPNRKPVKR